MYEWMNKVEVEIWHQIDDYYRAGKLFRIPLNWSQLDTKYRSDNSTQPYDNFYNYLETCRKYMWVVDISFILFFGMKQKLNGQAFYST